MNFLKKKWLLLILLFVVPPCIYWFVTKGSNNFIKLEIVGPKGHKISDFSFVNQHGKTVNNEKMEGNIYVANFFFTSCPSICPSMIKNMQYLQESLKIYPNIRFLSHTVDPARDDEKTLLSYINKMREDNIMINLENWDFVTGKKGDIYEIARNSYLLYANDEDTDNLHGGFIHSENFILVDKEGRIRSGIDKSGNPVVAYDGTSESQVKNLIEDIKVLMAEYHKPRKKKK